LTLKVAVIAVTLLLVASLTALIRGNYWLHGRINIVFFVLTITALVSLELIVRIIHPEIFDEYFQRTGAATALAVHLSFSVPAALLLPLMLFTGLRRRRRVHIGLGTVFLMLWLGTFITGVFFLPHANP
jgi:hypothetical protein